MKKLFTIFTMILILSTSNAYAGKQTIYADVNGLVCDFCAQALTKVFSKKDQVENIDVNLDTKIITINFKEDQILSHEVIEQLITDAGYNVVKIRHSSDTNE